VPAAGKIVITGTGRAGTTLLVQVLDALGLDTGLTDGRLTDYAPRVRAGLESRIDADDAPEVVKDMTLGFRMRLILEQRAIPIRHVLLPDRALEVAAASRIRASEYGRKPFARGGLTGTMRATQQARVLRRMRHEITSALDDFGVPYTTLEFPRFATDATYTQAALRPILPEATVADVQRALDQCVHAEMIHEAPLSRAERWRTRLTTTWMVLYRYPVAFIRGKLDPEGQQARIRASVAEARKQEAVLAEEERRAGRAPATSRDRPTTLP
jgi:hypothetical protein